MESSVPLYSSSNASSAIVFLPFLERRISSFRIVTVPTRAQVTPFELLLESRAVRRRNRRNEPAVRLREKLLKIAAVLGRNRVKVDFEPETARHRGPRKRHGQAAQRRRGQRMDQFGLRRSRNRLVNRLRLPGVNLRNVVAERVEHREIFAAAKLGDRVMPIT